MDNDNLNKESILTTVRRQLSRLFRSDNEIDTPPKPSMAQTEAVEDTGLCQNPSAMPKLPSQEMDDEAAERLRRYIEEHISDPDLNVVDMANDLKISRTGLFKQMHKYFGMTPTNYITSVRMEYATKLLSIGQKASVVAKRCGYADPKYFGKTFKKRYGILPSQYFKSLQDDTNQEQHNP